MSPPYKLIYFDLTGRAEPLRMLLSYGNLDFEDVRVPEENWPNLKASMPYGELPVLEYNGKTYHQSMAIARFLAKKVKLVGKDEFEDLEIDAAADTVNDFCDKVYKYYSKSDKNAEEKILFNEMFEYYLEKLNNIAKENGGYLVGGKLTWADLIFVGLLEYINSLAKKDLIATAPNLQKVKEHVVEVPRIKQYLAKRPQKN